MEKKKRKEKESKRRLDPVSPPLSGVELLIKLIDNVADAGKVLRFVVFNAGVEFFFERHDEFGGVQGVGAKVVGDIAVAGNRFNVASKLLGDDLDDLFFNIFSFHSSHY